MSLFFSSKYDTLGQNRVSAQSEFSASTNRNFSTLVGKNTPFLHAGFFNVFLGMEASVDGRQGNRNVFLGYQAGRANLASFNTFLGTQAGQCNLTGTHNVALGELAGGGLASGGRNLFLGWGAGGGVVTGGENVLLGLCNCAGPGVLPAASNLISIGNRADVRGGGSAICIGNRAVAQGSGAVVLGHGASSVGANNIVLSAGGLVGGLGTARVTGSESFVVLTPADLAHQALPPGEELNEAVNIKHRFVSTRDAATGAVTTAVVGDTVDLRAGQILLSGPISLGGNISAQANLTVESGLSAGGDVTFLRSALVGSNCDVRGELRAPGLTLTLPGSLAGAGADAWRLAPAAGGRELTFRSARGRVVSALVDDFDPSVLNFTGKHHCVLASSDAAEVLRLGMVLVATGAYCRLDGCAEPAVDEAIPVVALARAPRDPRVVGVVGGFDTHGVFGIGYLRFQRQVAGGARVTVNSHGEGGILVCGEGGDIRNGDLLVSSSTPGLAMRQADDLVRSCTVAKATCDMAFAPGAALAEAFVGCLYVT